MTPASLLRTCLATAALSGHLFAQAPATPAPAPKPKPTPPPILDKLGIKLIPQPGVAISAGDRAELEAGVTALGKDLTILRHNLKGQPELLALLPDVQIFHKAVDWALRYDEFFNVKQVATAKQMLELGNQRLADLKAGKASWNEVSGADGKPTADGKDKLPALVVRGYQSKIDGSIQPYGLVLPPDFQPGEKTPRRLDFWCHGRGETLSELDFLNQRLTSKGDYTPAGTIILHLYGRYCCANKFAGEVDLFEALDDVKKHYAIDPKKIVVRGFSMGGGAAWQFGTHFAGMWAAVQPGAGFADTREFMKLGLTPDKPLPPEWEQKLWAWYDSKDYVANLTNTTTVAYSGEIDGQKAAADIMIRSAREHAGNAHPVMGELNKVEPGDGATTAAEARVTGTAPDLAFYHVIALQTPHKIKPEAKPEVDQLVETAVAAHNFGAPKGHWTTYSLVYPKAPGGFYLTGLEKQWERADLDYDKQPDNFQITTKNIRSFSFSSITLPAKATIDGQPLDIHPPRTQPGPDLEALGKKLVFTKKDGQWQFRLDATFGGAPFEGKSPLVCGPIDHAFMDSFVFIAPTGAPLNTRVGAWAGSELEHAIGFWRKVFRGEAPVKKDTEFNRAVDAGKNLILWGDPSSNKVLAQIIDQLPVKWTATELVFNGQTYDPAHTALVMIFPNPLMPNKYVVINSGPTFREQALLNNADQTPKLPDWAIIDLNTPPDGKWPGEVKAAGFFDEQWKLPGK
jgi:hypothetical protein